MLIAHVSIPADDPKRAAEGIADIMQGEAMPFPPGGPNAWVAWSGDGEIDLEIVPRGQLIHRGDAEAEWRPGGARSPLTETHVAIGVDRGADDIIAVAAKYNWPARRCERGGGLFALVEVWVEGVFLIEFLDPAQTAHYRTIATPAKWKEQLAMHAPA